MSSTSYQVIIVGAGPVGLFLACELGAAGVSVVILERDTDPKSIWKVTPLGRRGLQPSSVEAFYRRGMLDAIRAPPEDTGVEFMKSFENFAGHFAGIMLKLQNYDPKQHPYHLPGPASTIQVLSLDHLQTGLTTRANELGIPIIRGAQVTSLDNNEHSVSATTSTGTTYTASYLVGCDGGRSFVRKAAGIPFEGTGPEFTGYTAIAELDRPELIPRGMYHTPNGGLMVHPCPNNYAPIDFDLSFDRSQPVTREHFEAVLQRTTQTSVKVKTLTAAGTYTARCNQAATYRVNRVLVAGDAAHIHSPLGGQGLNAGIGDALNLGWKLALTVQNRAPATLLDTYHSERYPVDAAVLDWTRAQVATLRPDGFAKAIMRVVKGMADTVDGATWLIGKIWGIETRYEVVDDQDSGVHDLVGRSAPDLTFEDGERLGVRLQKTHMRFVVLDLEGSERVRGMVEEELGIQGRVVYVGGRVKEDFGMRCLVIRPDGFVVGAVRKGEEVGLEWVKNTLGRWVV
ncbi:FAD-dependent oxidoreductase [Periconia macrospinosa]|uniref:FAD-dependent oxidoreductase n=1 Tax=Periconia macrospinosa TaxID=97972 RepID=A0A2V1DNX3_9PLEO|nr:FAD-dependent oxidoreductase [Periconia macrospinosa]